MKKIIFIFVALIVALSIAYFVLYYFFDTDLLEYVLDNQKGRADELRAKREGYTELKVFEYKYKFGVMDPETQTLIQHITFDTTGNILNEEFFLPYGKIKALYAYDKHSNPIQRNEYRLESIELLSKTFHTYKRGKLKTSITYFPDSSMSVRTYDENETEFTYIKYNKDSMILERLSNVNIYNDKNQIVEQRSLLTTTTTINTLGIAYDSIITITEFSYENNLLTSYSTIVLRDNTQTSFDIFRLNYDDNNFLVQKIMYNKSNEPIQAVVYEYH